MQSPWKTFIEYCSNIVDERDTGYQVSFAPASEAAGSEAATSEAEAATSEAAATISTPLSVSHESPPCEFIDKQVIYKPVTEVIYNPVI